VSGLLGDRIDVEKSRLADGVLTANDHDLDRVEVRIVGSAAVIGGQRVEGTTKGGRSRTVSIDPGTVQVFRDHRKRQVTERLTVGRQWRGESDDYVFTSA
jgi:hypothetical protein